MTLRLSKYIIVFLNFSKVFNSFIKFILRYPKPAEPSINGDDNVNIEIHSYQGTTSNLIKNVNSVAAAECGELSTVYLLYSYKFITCSCKLYVTIIPILKLLN